MSNGNLPAGFAVQAIPGPAVQRLSKEPYYDTAWLAAGVAIQQVTFFQIQLGGTFPVAAFGVKTQQDTNLQAAGQIPVPYSLLIQGFGMNVMYGATQADMNVLYNAATFTFFLGQTPMVQIPLCAIPTVGGFTGATTVNNTAFLCNGAPTPGAMFKVGSKEKKSIQLNAGEGFRCVIDWRAAITPVVAIRLQLFMFGLQGIPVR